MIPYTLIVASASRPHLLCPTLHSLFAQIDQVPERIVIHDDGVFPGRAEQVAHVAVDHAWPDRVTYRHDSPPLGHGPTLRWLLEQVTTEYCLYSQDDHVVVRPLPLSDCLTLMNHHHLHHVRFNKRDTMPYKESWQGRWQKVPVVFGLPPQRLGADPAVRCTDYREQTLTISDHWYFQTSLWRVAQIRPVVQWFMDHPHEGKWFGEHCEGKINQALDGNYPGFPWGLVEMPSAGIPPEQRERDQMTRARYQSTFIWGPVDEKAFIQHIGGKPEDWALPHVREPYDGKG